MEAAVTGKHPHLSGLTSKSSLLPQSQSDASVAVGVACCVTSWGPASVPLVALPSFKISDSSLISQQDRHSGGCTQFLISAWRGPCTCSTGEN